MAKSDYGFLFEKAGRSRAYGATSSDEEHFKGTSIAESLVRELGQNSLDAVDPDGDGVVRLEFELAEVETSTIPDVENLRQHIIAADESTRSIDKRNTRLKDAAEAIQQKSLMVLRVGDYGTRGLTGSERRDEKGPSPLAALTRGAGISADKDGGGGSFGVGSSVGTLASDVHTVFWTSLPKGVSEVVFAGYSQLATHRLPGGEDLQPDGFFIDRKIEDDFKYLRSPSPLGPFETRDKFGTDVYILGYAAADEDRNLEDIRNAIIKNFLVAIHRGKLVVSGKTSGGNWTLDQESLPMYVKSLEKVYPFYQALLDPEPYVRTIKGLGELKLYVEVNDNFPEKYHTIGIRKPLMMITEFRHTSIRMRYAAIMECSNDEGNEVLRALESPRHDKWEASRQRGGSAAIKKVKDFIRDGLKERMDEVVGDTVEIKGLEKYLPTTVDVEQLGTFEAKTATAPKNGEGTTTESTSTQGAPDGETEKKPVTRRKSVLVKIQKNGEPGGDMPGTEGKDRGGSSERKSSGGDIPGNASPGDGNSKIPAGDLRARGWFTSEVEKSVFNLRLSSPNPEFGNISLRALGPGGEVDDNFVLPIKKVVLKTLTGDKELEFEGNMVKGVDIAGTPASAKLSIEFLEDRRFSVAVV